MSSGTTGARGLAGSAALMFSGTLVSRVLGLLRNILLVAAIGLTGAANSFAVANRLPNVVYMLVAGGVLNAILVPQIVRAMKSRDGGDEYVNRLLTMAGAALLTLTVLLTAGASVLVAIYASGLEQVWFDLAVAFALWCVPQLFFYGMYTLLGQVLNAKGIFGPFMWAPAANNLVALIGLVAYILLFGTATATGANTDPAAWSPLRTAVIGGSATLGVVVQAVILIIPLRRSGFRYRPRWGLRGSGLGRAGKVATWAFASLLVAQVGFIAISNLAAAASRAATDGFVAGNAAWDSANFLYMLPQSLITVSLVTALFTRVSHYAATGQGAAVRDDLSLGLRTIAVFTVFAGGALAVVALPLVQAILPTATFPEAQGTAAVVVALLGGIAALGAFTMIQRVYYAYEDTKWLFRLQVPLTLIVIGGCLVSTLLPPQWWLVGAAVATTASNIVGSVVAYLALRRKLPSLDGGRVLRTHIRVVLAATPPLLAGWGLLHLIGPVARADSTVAQMFEALVKVAVPGLVMLVGYIALLKVLRVGELEVIARPVLAMVRRLLGRGGSAQVSTMGGKDTADPEPGSHRGSRTLDDHGPGTPPALAKGTLLSGRYLLQQEVSTLLPGTALWLGHDDILQREVRALLLPATTGLSAETVDAARRAALVDDARFERVLDVGTHEGHAFVVTDITTGPSLADLGGPLPAEQARSIIGEAASALETARRRGVHHLALSPSLVHVTDDGQVRISGLGVAGTYLGRERDQLAAGRIDTVLLVRLLYLALTGRWPVGEDAPAEELRPAPTIGGGPVAPSSLNGDVPADLDSLCVRTLGPDVDGPLTPSELIRELAPWRDIEPDTLTARPVPAGDDGDSGAAGGAAGAGIAGAVGASASAAAGALGAAAAGAAGSTAGTATAAGAAGTTDDEPWTGPPPRDGDTPRPAQPSWSEVVPTAVDDLDPSSWQPRPVSPDAGAPPEFSEVLAAAGTTDQATTRHPRGSVTSATLAAGVGGAAAAVAEAARRAGSAVRDQFSRSREKLADAAAARAAQEEAEAERRLAESREEAVQAALERESQPATEPFDRTVQHATTEFETPPAPVPTQPAPSPAREQTWEEVVSGDDDDAPLTRRRIDPTAIVLVLALIAVVFGAVVAFRTLTAEPEPRTIPESTPQVTEEPATATAPATDEASPEATEEPTTEPPLPDPVIASLAPLDPEGDGAENPDLTPRALDDDPSTYWRSRSYVDPAYGMKTGIGLHVELEEESRVSAVVIDLMGEGGNVEIRATAPDTPTEGEVLAEGEMGPTSRFTFDEPVATDSIVLWFTSLPVADSDGRNRLEVAELIVE